MHIDYINHMVQIMDYHNLLMQINQKTNDQELTPVLEYAQ